MVRSNEDERSDERIMAAYAAGDREAFRELFRRYAQRLHGFLYHMSGDRHLAQDLVQETFLRVHRARAAYDSARPFRPWIFRIAANVHADLARSWFWRLRARTLSLLAEGPGGASAPADRLAAGPATEAWAGAERAQTAALLRRELAALPAPQRTALLLHDLEGMSVREAAEAMGKPLGSVLSWIRRGRLSLRARLERRGGKGAWV